jgi:spermidine/putrescine-binding protein
MIKWGVGVFACAVALGIAMPQPRAEDTVTFAGFGGQYQTSVRKALFEPAAKKIGVKVAEETHTGLASVRVQVQSGTPAWDIVQLGDGDCAIGEKDGLFETLDYSLIKTDGIAPFAQGKTFIGSNYISVVMAWQNRNTKTIRLRPGRISSIRRISQADAPCMSTRRRASRSCSSVTVCRRTSSIPSTADGR